MNLSKYQIDMRKGPLFKQILYFTIPLIFTGVLQLLYNAVDIMIVGRFEGAEALAAVGSTAQLINLLIGLFIGISAGTSVVCSRSTGEGDVEAVYETVHTSLGLSVILGIIIAFIGTMFSDDILRLMSTPTNILPLSTLYLRIYFLGMPFFMIYNFGSAILRSMGDTRRPFYFLLISGVANLFFNVLFVVFLDMSVAGVAIATLIAQFISMLLVVRALIGATAPFRFIPKLTKIYKERLLSVLSVGLPLGIQSSLFSVANVLIQSSVNSFGDADIVAGVAASANLDTFVFISMTAFHQTCLSFTSQNLGAEQYKRMRKVLYICLGCVTVVGLALGAFVYFLSPYLLLLYTSNPTVIAIGYRRLLFIALPQFLCGIMDVMSGQLRGMGFSIMPTVISLTCVCVLRVVWILTVFETYRSLDLLFTSYPITWSLSIFFQVIVYIYAIRKFPNKDKPLEL